MKSSISDKWIKKLLSEKLDLIRAVYAPEKLILFGSRVRGKPSEEGDIDLVLVSDFFENTPFLGRMGHFLKTIKFPKHIDAFCYTPEEFERKSEQIGVVQQAVREGLVVIDKRKSVPRRGPRKGRKV
jgi:predicted nucleotidyltransferase